MRIPVVGSDGRGRAGAVLAQRHALPAGFSLQPPALVLSAMALLLIALESRSGAGAVR